MVKVFEFSFPGKGCEVEIVLPWKVFEEEIDFPENVWNSCRSLPPSPS